MTARETRRDRRPRTNRHCRLTPELGIGRGGGGGDEYGVALRGSGRQLAVERAARKRVVRGSPGKRLLDGARVEVDPDDAAAAGAEDLPGQPADEPEPDDRDPFAQPDVAWPTACNAIARLLRPALMRGLQ